MSKNKNKRTIDTLVDICVLTAGVIDPAIFEKCINAVVRESQSVPSRIFVMRNGKVAETQEAYQRIISSIPNVRVKNSNEDLGFPRGANQVMRSGTSPLILFVSDDIVLHERTLQKLVRRMDDASIGLCGLKLIFPPDSTDRGRPAGKVQHIGHGVDIRGEITHPLLGWSPENKKCCISREVQSVTGATFIVRRNIFLKSGGFYEGYGRGYFEDVDLNLTIRSLGYKVFIDTEATAFHYTGSTFIKRNAPMPMEVNKAILRARKAHLFQHDSWMFW